MPLIIPPGFGSASYVFTTTAGDGPFVTTMAHDLSSYGGDFVGAANALHSAFATAWGSNLAAQLTLDRVTLSVGSDGPGGSVDSDAAPVAMTRSATNSPVAESAIMRKVTNELGRRGRGRMFLPASLSDNDVDAAGTVLPARATQLNTAGEAWLNILNTDAQPLPAYLLHSQAPADPTVVVSLAVSDLIGWVRGRIR